MVEETENYEKQETEYQEIFSKAASPRNAYTDKMNNNNTNANIKVEDKFFIVFQAIDNYLEKESQLLQGMSPIIG